MMLPPKWMPRSVMMAAMLMAVPTARLTAQQVSSSPSHSSPPQVGRGAAILRTPLSVDELRADTRLSHIFNLDVRGVEIGKILDAVSKQVGVDLSVDPILKDRRYTGMAQRGTTLAFMNVLARTCRMSWRRLPESAGAPSTGVAEPRYELFRTDEQDRREKLQITRSEERETRRREELRALLRQAVQNALNGNDPNSGGFEALMASFSPEQMDTASDSALEPAGILSASDQSAFHNHFLYATPFSNLTAGQQAAVRSVLGQDQYHPTYASDEESGHPERAPDFSTMQVGLIAAAGGFRLGILEPDGKDVWVSPGVHIGSVPPLDPQAQRSDFDPTVEALLQSATIVNIDALPASLKEKLVRFPADLDRTSLSTVLGSIAEQTGIAISCDDFLSSRVTHQSLLPSNKEGYTLKSALLQVAKTFRHRVIYSNHCLYVDTLTVGLDLRLEPPAKVMQRLGELQQGPSKPDVNDTLSLGTCTRAQVSCIIRNHPIMRTVSGLMYRAVRAYPYLHFYALLTPTQRTAAEAQDGLSYDKMTQAQQAEFRGLTDVGLPSLDKKGNGLKPRHLYVQPQPQMLADGKTANSGLVLFISDAAEPPSVRRFDIH